MTKPFWVRLSLLLLCVLSWPSFSLQLFDGKSFLYDIGPDGALMRGTLDAYAGMYHLRVNRTDYVGNVTRLSPTGREARRDVFIEPSSGLEIRRNLYVSKTQNFARFSEILRNPTDAPITVEVEIYGKLGAGSDTVKIADQGNFLITGDVITVAQKNFAAIKRNKTFLDDFPGDYNSVSGGMPVLLHYHSQVSNPVTATHTLSGNRLSWIYSDVMVPAQSQVRLIYFVAQTTDVAAAHQVATLVFNNPTALYENMGPAAREQLLNFIPPKPIPRNDGDGDFSETPLLRPGELQTGALEEDDAWSRMRLATPADAYALNLAAGETVTIRMSAAFNAYLYFFQDVRGEVLVAANDDSGVNTTHAEIVFTATAGGTYYFEATAHNRGERGPYTLEMFAGTVNRSPNAYAFEFATESAEVPTTVTFTDFSTDVDGEIEERCWQFGDRSPMTCEASHTVTHTYQQPGYYSVGLTLRDDEGAYAYRSEQISIGSTPTDIELRVSTPVSGELDSSDVRSQTRSSAFADRYRITSPSAGQELVFDMVSDAFDSYLYLYDQFNRLLHQDDNSGGGTHARLRYTPMYRGDLWLEATSFQDNTLGKYNLSLELAENSNAVEVPIDTSPSLSNPLQYWFMARLPANFLATLLRWNFGDGSQEIQTTQTVVSYTYPHTGDFTVTVTALNADNQQLTGSQTFSIYNQPVAPVARFIASPLFGEKPLFVFFSNESTPSVAGESLRYMWQFDDGEVSTETNPAHTFTQSGTYQVTLRAYSSLTQQWASHSMPVTVIERQRADVPVTGTVREQPQVLMAGFDPMLVDLLDTEVKIFAIVRPGKRPLQMVRFIPNGSDVGWVMQHVATYANGDQRYETVYTFPQGLFSVTTLDRLFGEQSDQFQIQAIDQAGQFHAFPNLEIGHYPPQNSIPKSLNLEPLRHVGIRRREPQVLAAGFDPALVHQSDVAATLEDVSDADIMVKAIVREGRFPIQSVTLKPNQGALSLPMRLTEMLPNGDKVYAINYSYPVNSLEKGTLGNWFGIGPTQFTVMVVDVAQQSHSFPALKIGNFPPL